MFADNPSYFTFANGSATPTEALFLLRKTSGMGNVESVSSTSENSLDQQHTPPRSANQTNRSLRSFLRSMSLNSTSSNQELLIMGEPRLLDIAPDLASKLPISRESPRSSSHLQGADMMYFPLPQSEDAAAAQDVSGDEEVFVSEGAVKYYNFAASAPDAQQRRHSIGSFLTRDRTVSFNSSSKSVKDDVTDDIIPVHTAFKDSTRAGIDAHSLRHGSYPRKRCNRCKGGRSI